MHSSNAGKNWEQGFCEGLIKSKIFVPLLSKKAIKAPFESLKEDSRADNVLLEHLLALELQAREYLERVYPILISEVDPATNKFGSFFRQGCGPDLSKAKGVVVRSVEAKFCEHLENQGLGSPYLEHMAVSDIVDKLLLNQAGRLDGVDGGDLRGGFEKLADEIAAMVHGKPPAAAAAQASSSSSSTSSSIAPEALEARIQELLLQQDSRDRALHEQERALRLAMAAAQEEASALSAQQEENRRLRELLASLDMRSTPPPAPAPEAASESL